MSNQRLWAHLLVFCFWLFPVSFVIGYAQLYDPQTLGQWVLCLSLLVPWLICAPFVHRRHRQGLLWFSLLALVYLFTSLVGVQAPWPQRLWPLLDASLLSACFVLIMGYLRVTGPRARKRTAHHAVS